VFIEAKDDGGGGDNWSTGAISRAKLQSNHHQQQTSIHVTGMASDLHEIWHQQLPKISGKNRPVKHSISLQVSDGYHDTIPLC